MKSIALRAPFKVESFNVAKQFQTGGSGSIWGETLFVMEKARNKVFTKI
jgi:hypothetical protein